MSYYGYKYCPHMYYIDELDEKIHETIHGIDIASLELGELSECEIDDIYYLAKELKVTSNDNDINDFISAYFRVFYNVPAKLANDIASSINGRLKWQRKIRAWLNELEPPQTDEIRQIISIIDYFLNHFPVIETEYAGKWYCEGGWCSYDLLFAKIYLGRGMDYAIKYKAITKYLKEKMGKPDGNIYSISEIDQYQTHRKIWEVIFDKKGYMELRWIKTDL